MKLFEKLYAHEVICLLVTLLFLSFSLCLETLLTCPICYSIFVTVFNLLHLALSLFHMLMHVLVVSGRRFREVVRVILYMMKPSRMRRWCIILFAWMLKGDALLLAWDRCWEELLFFFRAYHWMKSQL